LGFEIDSSMKNSYKNRFPNDPSATDLSNWHIYEQENPDSSLKLQRRLFEKGAIDKLPWADYLKAQPDFSDNDAAEEAAKWAMEQLEKPQAVEDKKKDSNMDGTSGQSTNQADQRRLEGYVQNAEQNESTLWQRVKKGLE
jgi:hypothetical protein